MKKIVCILFVLLFQINWAQEVKVTDKKGTIKKVRNNQVTTSPTAPMPSLEGDIWFDNTDPNNLKTKILHKDGTWKQIGTSATESKTIILDKYLNADIDAQTQKWYKLPLNINDVKFMNSTYYSVGQTPGEITVNKIGNYLISSGISISNMPNGSTKYILALYVNNGIKGYLSRGYSSLSGSDWWGTTGLMMYPITAGQKIIIKYLINSGPAGSKLKAQFLNIGVTKL